MIVAENIDLETILVFFTKWLIYSCDNTATFWESIPMNPLLYQTLPSESIYMSTNTCLHILESSLAGGTQSSHFPQLNINAPQLSCASHTTLVFTHTLDKEFCCWQRRHKYSCQLAEVLQSDKKRISADSTPRSLFWAKHFVLPLQSCSPVNHQMFFATCVTFPFQYFYGLHATWQRVF